MKYLFHYSAQLLVALLLASGAAYSQTTTHHHFQSGFIQNLNSSGEPVLDKPYFCIVNGVKVFFTPNGLSYEVKGFLSNEEEGKKEKEMALALNENETPQYDDEDQHEGKDSVDHRFQVTFLGALEHVFVHGEESRTDYFISRNNQRCAIFDKITYHNVWPNIDIEFTLPEAGGLKYTVILHTGADLSAVQFDYSDALHLALTENGLWVNSSIGSWREFNPITFDALGAEVESNYTLNNSIVSFHIEGYSHETSYVIDPWIDLLPVITSYDDLPNPVDSVWSYTGFEQLSGTGINNAYNRVQIDYDVDGNIYVSQVPALFFNSTFGAGSYYSVGRFLLKYNSSGEQLFLTDLGYEDGFFSDITVNKQTQEIYSKRSAEFLIYSDSNGFEVEEFNIENEPGETTEICSMQFDHCQERLILGLGGSFDANPKFIATLSPDLEATFSYHDSYDYSSSLSNFLPYNDNVDVCIDPFTSNYLMLFLLRSSFQLDERALVNLNTNDMSSIWQTNDDFVPFTELYMHSLGLLTTPIANHFEALACGPAFNYAFNGGQLVRTNKTTGNTIASVSLPNMNTSRTEGIDTDMCGNVYIGQMNTIRVYDAELNNLGTIPIQGVPQDLAIYGDRLIVASDFNIQVIDIPENIKPWTITATPDSCDLCVGQARISFCNQDEMPAHVSVEWTGSGSTEQTLSGLCSGWYQVIIREVKNCLTYEYTDSVFVGSNATTNCAFNINAGNYTICEGECTVILVEPNGEVDSVNYNWGNGLITSSNELEVCADSTTVLMIVAQDEEGAIDTTYSTITVLPFPVVDLGSDTTLCPTASLLLDAANPDLNFLWQDNSTNRFFNVEQEGLYEVTVSNGICSTSDQIEIAYSSVSVDLGPDLEVCNPASVVLNAGGTGTTFLWDNGNSEQLLELTEFGTYSVIVSDALCSATDTISVALGNLIVNLGPDKIVCEGTTVTLSSGLSSGNFVWSTGSILSEINASEEGMYILEVTDGVCVESDSVLITTSSIQSAFTFENTIGCAPLTTAFIDESVSSTGNAVQWLWNFGDGTQSTEQNPMHSFLTSGTFEVSLQATNASSCTNTFTTSIEVLIYPSPIALFTYYPPTITTNENVQFTNESVDETMWTWYFGDGTVSTELNPNHIYTSAGNFGVVLLVANENCSDSLLVNLFIRDELFVYVPNSFTPNNDDINEVFAASISGAEIVDFSLTIFNRWGDIVFESNDSTQGWNGSVQNKTTASNGAYYAQDGVYIWYLNVRKDNSSEVLEFTGHVNLQR